MIELASHQWSPGVHAAMGATPPLALLVHGVLGWHRTWWRVAPALAQHGWRVVAVDQRGHGHSPRIGGPVTVADLAADLEATVEALGGRVDLLVGHSLGGAVALEVAAAHPSRVGRLVAEDPPAITRVGDAAWLDQLEGQLASAESDFEGEVARTMAANPLWLEEDARQDVEGKTLADGPGLVASFRADVRARVVDLLPQLTVSTLLVLADPARSVFPEPVRDQVIRRLPANVRPVVIEAGHTIHRDRFDDYLATILEWSAGPPA